MFEEVLGNVHFVGITWQGWNDGFVYICVFASDLAEFINLPHSIFHSSLTPSSFGVVELLSCVECQEGLVRES